MNQENYEWRKLEDFIVGDYIQGHDKDGLVTNVKIEEKLVWLYYIRDGEEKIRADALGAEYRARRRPTMTEQEKISAIEALGVAYYWKIKNKPWYADPQNDQESLIHVTVYALRALNNDNHLNTKDVCEYLIAPCYEEATEEQKMLCDNAVQAMQEILEEERTEAI